MIKASLALLLLVSSLCHANEDRAKKLEEFTRVESIKESFQPHIIAEFPSTSVGVGSSGDELTILLTAQDPSEQSVLEQRYPANSRVHGVLIEVTGSGAVTTQPTAPSLVDYKRAEAVKNSLTAKITAKFPWASVGIGGVPGEFVLRVVTQDSAEVPALLEEYPAGTRIEGFRVEIEEIGPIVAQGDSVASSTLVGRCADVLSGVIERFKNLIKR